MSAVLKRRTAASSSSAEIGPSRTNWSRISDGTGVSGASRTRVLRRGRGITAPHVMPHTQNSWHARFPILPVRCDEALSAFFGNLRFGADDYFCVLCLFALIASASFALRLLRLNLDSNFAFLGVFALIVALRSFALIFVGALCRLCVYT